jgi:sugar O-acyltransferase (sialic acid O-acetyltransferase NeuD family)
MILFGASGHCKVIVDLLLLNTIKIEKILDDNPVRETIFGIPVEKNVSSISKADAIICIGNNKIRKKIAEKYDLYYKKAIHPSATVSKFTTIGNGTVIMAKAVVNADAIIGDHCNINSGAIVEHECEIGDFVHISPNATIAGNVKIGEGTEVGIGAAIIPGKTIGKWCVIGASSVVTHDIPDFCVVVGNLGRIIRKG